MNKHLLRLISATLIVVVYLFTFLLVDTNHIKPAYAGNIATGLSVTQTGCGDSGKVSATFNWTPADNPVIDPGSGLPIPVVEQILDYSVFNNGFAPTTFQARNVGIGNATTSFTDHFVPDITYYWRISTSYYPGGPGSFSFSSTRSFVPRCIASGGTTSLGTVSPPPGIPNPYDSTAYVAGIIKNGLSLLVIIAFLAALLWTIFAGFRFVTSGGDEKSISQAWSSIYWGLIGMIVVVASYAIVKLVETFFNVSIISGGLVLP